MIVLGAFLDFVRGIHIIAVILSFGVLFIYPLLRLVGVGEDRRALPWFHRFQYAVHMRIQAPGLALVALAGIYLASDEHQWSTFYVGWGLAAVIVIGAIGGAYISPREKRMIELADAPSELPAEYRTAARQADLARLLQLAITVLTVFFMSMHVGA